MNQVGKKIFNILTFCALFCCFTYPAASYVKISVIAVQYFKTKILLSANLYFYCCYYTSDKLIYETFFLLW